MLLLTINLAFNYGEIDTKFEIRNLKKGPTISRVENNTSCTTRGMQRKDSLDGNVHVWSFESLKHDFRHLFPVSLWVEWSFSEKNWMFFLKELAQFNKL